MGGRGGSSGNVLSSVRNKLEKQDWWKDTEKYERNPLRLLKSPAFMYGIEDRIGRELFNRGYHDVTDKQVKSLAKQMVVDLDKKVSKSETHQQKVESQDEYAKRYFKEHYDKNRQPREITTQTYERAQKRLQNNINSWFGRGMNKKK